MAGSFRAHFLMSKPVTTFVFKVLRNGLLRYILHTLSKPVITFVFKVLRNGLLPYVLGKSTEKATDKLLCF